MTTEVKETLVAFCTGDILATVVAFNFFSNIGYPVLMACITGFLGGGAAIGGKIFVQWLEKKFKK